jgi:hypothetical protein
MILKTEPLNNVGPLILGATIPQNGKRTETAETHKGTRHKILKMMRALWTRRLQIEINNVSH